MCTLHSRYRINPVQLFYIRSILLLRRYSLLECCFPSLYWALWGATRVFAGGHVLFTIYGVTFPMNPSVCLLGNLFDLNLARSHSITFSQILLAIAKNCIVRLLLSEVKLHTSEKDYFKKKDECFL